MPIPVAVVHAGDLRALAVNELMARFLHRADAAGLTISAMPGGNGSSVGHRRPRRRLRCRLRVQGQLFKRFARIEPDENRHLVGMGIGRCLVQEVARAHGGRVLVDGRMGVGSDFRFELPRM